MAILWDLAASVCTSGYSPEFSVPFSECGAAHSGQLSTKPSAVPTEKRNAYGDFLGAVLQAQRESEPGISGSRRPPYEMMLGLSEKQGLVQVVGTDEIVELCNDVVVAVGVLSFVLSETYGSENTEEQTTHMIVKSRKTDQEAFKQLVKAIRSDLRID
ncbi:hypothetical protein ACX80Z_15785 [Arthrobacter sp. TMT4-20]